jgi:hypothetical protein
MADEAGHLEQASRNQDFLGRQLSEHAPFWDWIAVTAFYKAIHVVEAVFFNNEPRATAHSIDHRGRNHLLKTKYPDIWRHYYHLFRTSLIARYLEFSSTGPRYSSFSDFMTDHLVLTQLLALDLVGVETEAIPYLSGAHTLRIFIPPPPPPASTPSVQ